MTGLTYRKNKTIEAPTGKLTGSSYFFKISKSLSSQSMNEEGKGLSEFKKSISRFSISIFQRLINACHSFKSTHHPKVF